MAEHNTLGKVGEIKAKEYLESKGYIIFHTNWRYKHKEIDLVALKNDILVFVEVKTRSFGGMQNARECITKSKMRFLIEAADAYVTMFNRPEEVRFDLLALTKSPSTIEIEHIENAFNALDI
ncbi:putative endonuclease [Balneicella halophila]|uniref:UPF0102 protein C7377_0350 n=1 Tax=Balneicella halophila TaxID=1537566 RepID=A0A7L4UQK4_BALHA|nr:YraN family protein [Balneicella halophila]PVX52055.1 putative endonuclease [Balneicella halophila]